MQTSAETGADEHEHDIETPSSIRLQNTLSRQPERDDTLHLGNGLIYGDEPRGEVD